MTSPPRDHELAKTLATPGYHLPESRMFGHATRLMDCWTPKIEQILLPAEDRAAGQYRFAVKQGVSRQVTPYGHTKLQKIRRRLSTVNLKDRHVFDARNDTENNVAHIIVHVVVQVLIAQREIEAAGGQSPNPLVVLRAKAWPKARQVYQFFGLETLATDAAVKGRIISGQSEDHPHSLQPEVYRIDPPGTRRDTPSRVYLARSGARSVENDEQVTAFLSERGYERVEFDSSMSIAQQWSTLRNATHLVAAHGAALSWMVAMANRDGSGRPKLIELFGPGYIVDLYRQLAAMHGVDYVAVRGRITPEVVGDLDFGSDRRAHTATPFRVDLEALGMALDWKSQ